MTPGKEDSEAPTLTMQGIADLAQVKRPVVSVWRSRYSASSDAPFPEPRSVDPLRFDAAQVVEWLATTGRGNNPDAALESSLHSKAFALVAADADRASVLLLLHHVLGEPVTGMRATSALAHVDALQLSSIVDTATLTSALADEALCAATDAVAEAAFSGAHVLDRLVDGFAASEGPWAHEALAPGAQDLFGAVIAELVRACPRMIVPTDLGGLVLASGFVRHLSEHERPMLEVGPELLARPADRAAWRRLGAHGFPLVSPTNESADVDQARLYFLMRQSAQSSRDLCGQVEQRLLGLAADDLLMVVGPARVLTDREGRRDRVRLLAPTNGYAAPLRYVARLPKGLSRFGGQRRLALWVFGRAESHWTVVGDHAASPDGTALAADVTAALATPADVSAHAFLSSSVRETRRLVRQPELVAGTPSRGSVPTGGERLARIWALRDELAARPPSGHLFDDIDLTARESLEPGVVRLAQAVPRLARDLAGVRIGGEHLGAVDVGYAPVIGPGEVRDPASIGRRGIDRLTLEAVAPRARLTDPGDVVYVAAGGPAAIVDDHGGHVVLAPARIVRCRRDAPGDRRLVAPVVVADIAAQRVGDRQSWRLRTVDAALSDELSALAARIVGHRRRLLHELGTLDDLERELVGGLADGSLTASFHPSLPSTTPKAAR